MSPGTPTVGGDGGGGGEDPDARGKVQTEMHRVWPFQLAPEKWQSIDIGMLRWLVRLDGWDYIWESGALSLEGSHE